MAGYNPTLTHIENPNATTLIQWSQKEGEGAGVTSGGKKGLVNFVVSDTGLVTVVNYNALSRAAKLSGGKVGVGVDTLDPNNVYLNIWPISDQHQPTVAETLENMIMQPRTGGIGGEGKQVERG